MRDYRLRIMAGDRKLGRCRDCGASIEWAVTPPHGKMVPLNPRPLVLEATCNEQTQVRFYVVGGDSLHFATCPNKRPRAPKPARLFA